MHAVIVPRDKATGLTSVVRKGRLWRRRSGAAHPGHQPGPQPARELQERGVWIVGTAGEADHDLYRAKLTGPVWRW